MEYTFEFVGVAPVLNFFNHQQETQQHLHLGAEYVGAYRCTLDAVLESVEPVPPKRGWNLDEVVDTVIHFWLHNSELVQHWKERLEDAGKENLIVARLADVDALRTEFEALLGPGHEPRR